MRLEKIEIPSFVDDRGTLAVLELEKYVEWPVKRIYFVTDTVKPRGFHAVRGENKFYICQKGTIECRFHDGKEWFDYQLKGPGDAILMEGFYYREFFNFSDDAVLLAVSSVNYSPDDYVYDFDTFLKESQK